MASVDQLVKKALEAAPVWEAVKPARRAQCMKRIGDLLEEHRQELIALADEETALGPSRLDTELTRTIYQLRTYGEACAKGYYLGLSVDERTADQPELRKMNLPLGPVAVFGASNFPFAYSTAGGDTACALAAGCPVIVRGHAGHIQTSIRVANLIGRALAEFHLPKGVFGHLSEPGNEPGAALVKHPGIKAVGFTGSFGGGMALHKLGQEREEPIPVFAEMGSVNPIYVLPSALGVDDKALARKLVDSITLSMGQFCTNPGLVVLPDGVQSASLLQLMADLMRRVTPAQMLNKGIYEQFERNREEALKDAALELLAVSRQEPAKGEAWPTLSRVAAADFMHDNRLHQEVFGPFSVAVVCKNLEEMTGVAKSMQGQLTCTVHGSPEEIRANSVLLSHLREKCGRLIFNGVPTGVRVAHSMQHGGPFPATTDSRYTSVGADGIIRFMRPVCYQDCPHPLLPELLQDSALREYPYFLNGLLVGR